MKVAVLMGSKSDWPVLKKVVKTLKDLKIDYEVEVLSAHRTPIALDQFIDKSESDIFICGAGGAAHLAGAVAAMTTRPVIGIPIANTLQGLDSLLSTAQMPPGVPVATVGTDNGINAAILAAQMLAIYDEELRDRIADHRTMMALKVYEASKEVNEEAKLI